MVREGRRDVLLLLNQTTDVGDMVVVPRQTLHLFKLGPRPSAHSGPQTSAARLTSRVMVPLNETPVSALSPSVAAASFPTQSIVVLTTLYCACLPRSCTSSVWIESHAPWLPD